MYRACPAQSVQGLLEKTYTSKLRFGFSQPSPLDMGSHTQHAQQLIYFGSFCTAYLLADGLIGNFELLNDQWEQLRKHLHKVATEVRLMPLLLTDSGTRNADLTRSVYFEQVSTDNLHQLAEGCHHICIIRCVDHYVKRSLWNSA